MLAGLKAAKDAGLNPVKINTVLLRGINEDDAVPLLEYCLEHGYELRFIEQMPLDAHHAWTRGEMVTAEDILARLTAALHPGARRRGARRRPGGALAGRRHGATVGVIASVTRPFCGACDRTRLTADGQIRNCLFAREESDLRTALRAGADDQELADRWRIATLSKLPGTASTTRASCSRPGRCPRSAADGGGHGQVLRRGSRRGRRGHRDLGRRPASTSWSGRSSTPHGERLERVLTACSFLVDGTSTRDRALVLAPGAVIDVLPPFAGG